MTEPVLSLRALNRALLVRQHLLAGASAPPEEMVERLVGLQAQVPGDPYVALWSRLDGFRPEELSTAIEERRFVRMGLMRTTLHLVTARDAVALWPVLRGVLDRSWSGTPFRRDLDGVELPAVLDAARAAFADGPQTIAALGRRLATIWPDRPAQSLAYAARFHLPIVQLPPRGLWGRTGQPTWQLLETWLGVEVAADPVAGPDELVLRYLAAFGPATAKDVSTWSWLTGVRAVLERLRPRLRVFRDDRGAELFDVHDGPLPDPETPAPPRFLPEYDNVALSHADRARIIAAEAFGRVSPYVGTFLIDGFVSGQWRLVRDDGGATIALEPFVRLSGDQSDELVAEAARLAAFLAPDATSQVALADFALDPAAPAAQRGSHWAPRVATTRRPPASRS